MRARFSAFGHFCEAIVQFLANADKDTISKAGVFASMYSGEVFSAYEMMVGQWVNKNESSVGGCFPCLFFLKRKFKDEKKDNE